MSGVDEGLAPAALDEILDVGLVLLSEDGRVAWANSAFLDLLDRDSVEGVGELSTLVAESVDDGDLQAIASADEGVTVTIETESGEKRVCELRLGEDSHGGYIGRIRENDGERENRELQRYRTVVNTVDDGVYMTDENRRFTWVNDAVERMYGYDRETLVGSHVFEFMDESTVPEAKQMGERLRSSDTPDVVTFEMETTRKDGTTLPVEVRSSLLPGEGFTGTVGIIRDISDRKERERELERKNERLEEFTDTLTHDLRNPLTVANARVELLQMEHDSEHFEPLQEALEHMDALIDDLLTLAHQDGDLNRTETVEIGSLARTSWSSVPTDEAELAVEADPSLEGNPTRLRQALENLFHNAVEHAGPAVTVRVGALDRATGFYVEDDGPGIPVPDREDVLEPGFTTDASGTGYGLHIVQQIASAHEWRLNITDGSEGGARFEFVVEE